MTTPSSTLRDAARCRARALVRKWRRLRRASSESFNANWKGATAEAERDVRCLAAALGVDVASVLDDARDDETDAVEAH
jgi:hypothetical protein